MSEHMPKRIAVLGAGAIGSSVGADLTEAGYDVTLIDQWPAQVQAMQARGLRIVMPDRELRTRVRAMHLCDLAGCDPRFDIVLMAVKSYDTRWLAQLIEPYLTPEGWFVGVQNGMNDEAIASIVGRSRVIGCCVELSAEIFTPGIVQRNTPRTGTWFGLGELDGRLTERVHALETILRNAGKVSVTGNIVGAKWTKLIANTMTMGPFGLLGLKNWEAAELPGMFEISVRLGRESMAVGAALGYRMEPIFGLLADEFAGASDEVLITAMKTLLGHVGSNSRTAVVHDNLKGRRSELEHISGLVVRKGKELGIPTPCNAAVAEIDRRIHRGELRMEPANFELLKQLIVHSS
ncbi:MAG: 2-dehydropantoate 2-reductase [Betaproteobacteria bacterium]|nr:MAG: 2-dehydropantoate 2-reductase [Betaproteobacteria bacterium]